MRFNILVLRRDVRQMYSRISMAVIQQAAKDMLAVKSIEPGLSRLQRQKRESSRLIAGEAKAWAMDTESDNPFSLRNCCEHINEFLKSEGKEYPLLTPELLRRALLSEPQQLSNNYFSWMNQEMSMENVPDPCDLIPCDFLDEVLNTFSFYEENATPPPLEFEDVMSLL